MEVEEYFDKNVEAYDSGAMELDYDFFSFIKETKMNKHNLLDIGGGNGNFSKLITQNFPDIHVTVLDPSKKLLKKIDDSKINKVVGKLPYEVHLDSKFDYIHVRNVFHHITGNSIKESNKLLKESLECISGLLDKNGFLLIQESLNEGYLFPKLPRYLIFHLLLIQNKFNIKIPFNEFMVGLNVCFYTRSELKSILEDCGFELMNHRTIYSNFRNKSRNLLLIRYQGQFSFIVRKKD